ncbi:MAG: 4Fe-4S binding protein, partial [Candidatus Poribacteria bacterium]
MEEEKEKLTKRDFIKTGIRGLCLLGMGGILGLLVNRARGSDLVWQLDPYKCIQCGRCADNCVL